MSGSFETEFAGKRALVTGGTRGILRLYNTQRPHQGYRLRGQTPSALFWGAAALAS